MITWWKTILAAIVALIVSYVATPIVKGIAEKLGATYVEDDEQREHDYPVPLLGGVAIWLAVVVATIIFVPHDRPVIGMILGATLITLQGILDDRFKLSPWIRLIGQVIAAGIVIYCGLDIDALSFIGEGAAGYGAQLGWFSIPITIIWIVLCTNAMILIDGLDGLAAGISAIAAVTLMIASIWLATPWYVAILLAAILGACLGFLPYNLYPAKIFLGDTGAELLGFLLSVVSIMSLTKFHALVPFVVPVLALALPLGDATFAVFRRVVKKRSIFHSDSGRIHHRLLATGMSHRQVVAVMHVVTVFFCFASLIVIRPGSQLLRIILIVFVLVAAFLTQFMFFPIKTKEEDGQHAAKGQKKVHILVVSQYFYPENFRINDMTCEWVKRGYQVTVLTGVPNYPVGEFFPGYSWTRKRHEVWNGVEILRIPVVPRGHGPIGMVLNYFSFVVTGWIWNMVTEVDADLVFSFETSPMTQVKVGCRYAKRHHVPHFAYIQDLWPENVEVVTGIHNPIVIKPIDRMVDKIYKDLDEIYATSPSFVEAIVNRKVPVPRKKVHYWPQYAEEFYRPIAKADVFEIPNDGSLKIAFTGNLGFAQGLDILPKAAEMLKDEDVKFVIVGGGRYQEKFEEEIRERKVQSKFILVPRQAPERIPEILSACDAGFVSFAKDPLWENTIPAKLQTYMACGKAIIASASGETERIIIEAQCGFCTACGDPAALAEAIRYFKTADRETMEKNARTYFEANFTKKMLMDEMDVNFAARIG